MIQTLCYLLEALLTPDNTPPDSSKELYELYFVFAAVWAFGGSMFQDQVIYMYMYTHITHTVHVQCKCKCTCTVHDAPTCMQHYG